MDGTVLEIPKGGAPRPLTEYVSIYNSILKPVPRTTEYLSPTTIEATTKENMISFSDKKFGAP